ncbi:hypothetical protein [Polaribacter sp. L3A8]|uniref:hypothetical protein n=1 Tax=Polaribacter sp. L3A8 TaxID=2686361 RepID=UPI00131D287F|nr:hypothetical protein [Polaribacter sp. L3A8]
MKITPVNTRFIKWLSAEEMHNDSKEWLIDLEFLNDEYLFFEDLIKWNTLQLIDFQSYSKSKEFIEILSNSKKTNDKLIELVKKHKKGLEVLVDVKDEPKKEEAYKTEHKTVLVLFKNHLKEHRALKLNLFEILKKIKKTEKGKRIIDVE